MRASAENHAAENNGPLKGIRVFDMTRILAGPSATQILGDLGADVLKIEKPGAGDDTRTWGPPYVKDDAGADTPESSYYLSANRNKRSLSLDFTRPEGLAIAKKLLASCDVLFENHRAGGLAKYGLGYEQLKEEFPRLIYCSLTGFGQNGPYRDRAGYDYLVQGLGGIMSLTGPAEGPPCKVGIAWVDLLTGLYALNGILAALYHREKTGRGQFIDVSLLDTQVAALSNAGQYYLTGGEVTPRMGNAHPTIVPYETFAAADGWLILAVGNDRQFIDFCTVAKRPELASDPRFAKNRDRVENRSALVPVVREIISSRPRRFWFEELEKAGVPCGPVNALDQVFADPQVKSRNMVVEMNASRPLRLLASPLRFSATPVSYRRAPPSLGQHTDDILRTDLSLTPADISNLRNKGVV
jgi:crotonobetainyl-CoA:carnitine CoA-transferase CaiB-like acyl-CoA transferase